MRRKRASTSEYLAFLSAKYEVDPNRLFNALILAVENRESKCGDFLIQYRGETRDKVMFLILMSSDVVAQFSVFKEFLLEKGHPIGDLMETDKIRRFLAKKATQSSAFPIRDLRNGMTRVCLKAKVLEIPKPSLVCTRYGNYASVANALIADETGTIRLCLWNEQIGCISEGETIIIENARISTFRGQRQLRIGKKSLVSSVNDSSLQLNPMITS